MRKFYFIAFICFFSSVLNAETRPYWIFFSDRGEVNVENAVSAKIVSPTEPKSTSRRARLYGERIFDEKDVPVNPDYIKYVTDIVGGIRTVSRYFNGVSVDIDEDVLEQVRSLPFVSGIQPVNVFTRPKEPAPSKTPPSEKPSMKYALSYGNSYGQLSMTGIPELHEAGYMGNGITIAVLDSGFDNLGHAAFDGTHISHKRDFVDGDDDPEGDDHGTEVLSVMAALDPDVMIGAAPYARYLLARTEIVEGNVELRIEEDHFIAGIEWADSLGADIVHSSLGYTTFDDGTGYAKSDLDGNTALTTIAADIAVSRGMVVVTSAGNEGDESWYTITTPADGDSVFAVGAVGSDKEISSFSSRGPSYDGRVKPDFVALGEYVWVATAGGSRTYRFVNGTSYSAPLVSGGIALILEVNPEWTFQTLRSELIATADDLGIAGPDSLYGYGLFDALAASGFEPPVTEVSRFRVHDPYSQPISFGESNDRLYFPVDIPVEGLTLTIRIFSFNGENIQIIDYVKDSGNQRTRDKAPSWDGKNFIGEYVGSGIYYYTISLFGYGRHMGKIAVIR
ncbi:hypothetical protein ES708_26688 [subsurface metagenome]